jgi:nitroreductase
MEYRELIQRRYSARAYRTEPVDDKSLSCVLEAARLAPTAANRQPFRIVVCRTQGRVAELQRVYPREWLAAAPLVLCVCGVPGEAWVRRDGRRYLDVDVAIVMDHIVLAATDLGLGTCWIAAFDAAAAREMMRIPPDIEPIVLTPLGTPADAPTAKKRRPLSELVRYDRF